jgi:hypothetical protein
MGGLLLVLPYLLQCQFHVYGWAVRNNKTNILGVKYIVKWPHVGYGWSYSHTSLFSTQTRYTLVI